MAWKEVSDEFWALVEPLLSAPKKHRRLLSGSGVMGSGLVVNRLREAESLRIGPDRDVDPLVALVAEESESHGRPDQVDEPARRGKVL
jgi:hypothetical protein